MHVIKYRLTEQGFAPRRTRLQVPGWSGEPQPRQDGSLEQAWHCVPFSEAAKYEIEVFCRYERELRVTTRNGRLVFGSRIHARSRGRSHDAAGAHLRRSLLHVPALNRLQAGNRASR